MLDKDGNPIYNPTNNPNIPPLISCFDQFDNPTNPCPEHIIPEQIVENIRTEVNKIITELEPFGQVITPHDRRHASRVTSRNYEFMREMLDVLKENENLVMDVIDVQELEEQLDSWHRLDDLEGTLQMALQFISDNKLKDGIDVRNGFNMSYRCLRQKSEDGITQAVAAFARVKPLYDHLRGPRGPMCQSAEEEEIEKLKENMALNKKEKHLRRELEKLEKMRPLLVERNEIKHEHIDIIEKKHD